MLFRSREIEKNQVVYQMVHEDDVDLPAGFDLEESLMERHWEDAVKGAIDKLPDAQRAALVLWIEGARSYDEIAAELKTSVSSVKSLLFRAKQNLAEKLKAA